MKTLTKELIDKVIEDIKAEVESYNVSQDNLAKFKDNPADREFLSCVNGAGGQYCKFLAMLVRKLEIKKILELGNREGLSTLCIYDALAKDAAFTSIDIIKDLRYVPGAMFTDSRVNFIYGDVSDLKIFNGNYPFGTELLFTDTVHNDFQLRNEYSIYQHFLADSALLAIDDINFSDKRKLFDELPFPKWDLTEFCHLSGWGLVLYERKQPMDEREKLLAAYRASAEVWQKTSAKLQIQLDNSFFAKTKKSLRSFLHKNKPLHKASLLIRGKF